MKSKLFFLLTTLLFALNLNAQDLQNLKHEIEKIIEFDFDISFDEGEGIWIGVIDSDSTFIFKIGNIAADSLAEFQLGSLSKIFTYRSLEKLLAKNEIDIKSNVIDYLELNATYENISFHDLATHTSMLPKEPYFLVKEASIQTIHMNHIQTI